MRLSVWAMCGLLSVTLASPVFAAPKIRDDAFAVLALHNFAACAANRTPDGAVHVLAMDFRTPGYREAIKRYAIGHSYCAPGASIGFGGVLFAGALAEAMLVHHMGSAPLTDRLSRVASSAFEARSESERLSICVIQRQPDALAAIFDTESGSEKEDVALRSVGPALRACVAADGKAVLNRPALRALLALAAYRMITYPGATPVAGN